MRRGRYYPEDDPGQDSFLDVIANVVGVLIILVMLVGVRASHQLLVTESEPIGPSSEVHQADFRDSGSASNLANLQEELKRANQKFFASRSTIRDMATKVVRINHEARQQDQHRNELAMHRALIEDDLKNRRAKLDSESQHEFDVQRQLIEAQIKLDELSKEQMTLLSAPSPTEEIVCYPTPIAKEIGPETLHLCVKKGLVSIVPFMELMDQLEGRRDSIRRSLQARNKAVETIGPLNGYRLRFIARKINPSGAIAGPIAGKIQKTIIDGRGQYLPTSDNLGQNIEQALMPGTAVSKALQNNVRYNLPVTVWLYNDSYDEFRLLKKKLSEIKLPVAVRNMPVGVNIGFSPNGSKSMAQ